MAGQETENLLGGSTSTAKRETTTDDLTEKVETQTYNESGLTSNFSTLMHLIKGNIGTGLLSMAWALQHAGILLGSMLLVIMAVVCTYCMFMLSTSSKYHAKRLKLKCLDYPGVSYHAFNSSKNPSLQRFAEFARNFTNALLMITQLGFCCVYFVFMSQNILQVVKTVWHDAPSDRVFMAIILVPIMLLSFIRSLKVLTWFSSFANVATVASLAIVFYYVLPGLGDNGVPPLAKLQLPTFFGTAIFAFEGIGVVLPLENNMKSPKDFNKILVLGMTVVAFMYIFVGVTGYLKYGDDICGSITLNLPPGEAFADLSKLLYSIVIMSSYLIQFYVPIQIIENALDDQARNKVSVFVPIRALLVTLTCALAVAIPNLGDYISLIGALSSSFLALILPPIIDILTFHSSSPSSSLLNENEEEEEDVVFEAVDYDSQNNDSSSVRKKLLLILNIVIIVVGILGFATGTYSALKNIVYDLSHPKPNDQCSGGTGNVTVW